MKMDNLMTALNLYIKLSSAKFGIARKNRSSEDSEITKHFIVFPTTNTFTADCYQSVNNVMILRKQTTARSFFRATINTNEENSLLTSEASLIVKNIFCYTKCVVL